MQHEIVTRKSSETKHQVRHTFQWGGMGGYWVEWSNSRSFSSKAPAPTLREDRYTITRGGDPARPATSRSDSASGSLDKKLSSSTKRTSACAQERVQQQENTHTHRKSKDGRNAILSVYLTWCGTPTQRRQHSLSLSLISLCLPLSLNQSQVEQHPSLPPS